MCLRGGRSDVQFWDGPTGPVRRVRRMRPTSCWIACPLDQPSDAVPLATDDFYRRIEVRSSPEWPDLS
jgi:hypothetical protein